MGPQDIHSNPFLISDLVFSLTKTKIACNPASTILKRKATTSIFSVSFIFLLHIDKKNSNNTHVDYLLGKGTNPKWKYKTCSSSSSGIDADLYDIQI